MTHVKEFSLSPWIQENQDLQNGRILLVLESVGGVRKRLHNERGTGFSGPRKREVQGNGLERWNLVLFFAGEQIETFNLLDVLLDHSGLFNVT